MISYSDAPGDGDLVDDSEVLIRFSAPVPEQWEDGHPTVAAMSLRKGENGLSGYLRFLLQHHGVTEDSVLLGRDGYGLFALAAAVIFREGCNLLHNPVSPPERVEDPSHAVIVKPDVSKPQWLAIRSVLLASATVLATPSLP